MDNSPGNNEKTRLNKFIAAAGICSRRAAETLIDEGRVSVNGEIITQQGTTVTKNDTVAVDGKKITSQAEENKLVYIVLNKPVDIICSADNTQGTTVLDLLTMENYAGRNKRTLTTRVYPVGRLDKDSEGLVLLTNDGRLTNRLTHPRYGHEKEYFVTLTERLARDAEKVLTKGMTIDGEYVQGIKIKNKKQLGKRYEVQVILREGKNRQIRKMFGNLGYRIVSLRRIRIGKVTLGGLSAGQWKFISKSKIV